MLGSGNQTIYFKSILINYLLEINYIIKMEILNFLKTITTRAK